MKQRNPVLLITLAFLALLTFLTLNVWIRTGFDILVLVSLIILGTIGYGVLGALLNPPDE